MILVELCNTCLCYQYLVYCSIFYCIEALAFLLILDIEILKILKKNYNIAIKFDHNNTMAH